MDFTKLTSIWPALQILKQKPIAYFCAEFALSDQLPIYSGGLGVLAGDVIREANRSNIPLVGIGLLYKEGYFTQIISSGGLQDELPAYADISSLPIIPVLDNEGKELKIKLYIANRIIAVRVWQYKEGSISVYLLDTDVPENQDLDKRLTLTLYPTNNEWRIQQEIILGVGGARLLNRLGIIPSVHHLNEGHSAFAILEIAHQHMKRTSMSFSEAFKFACDHTVFTNHTLIPSGNDIFDTTLVIKLLNEYAEHLGLPINDIIRMGAVPGQDGYFSMTHLALSASKKVSAVSKTHAEIAKVTWPDRTLAPITNGVYKPYWQGEGWEEISGKLERGLEVSDAEIWHTHQNNKAKLLQYIADNTGVVLKPETLTITWARRIAGYKQPLMFLSDVSRLTHILQNTNQPLQIIISGKAHPGDSAAKGMITEMLNIIKQHGLSQEIIFLPNYNLTCGKLLTSGSDVWLGTPIKGQEACGTSGMKAGLNGCLQFTISDGWTDEVTLDQIGFPISPIDSANSLYNTLERTILPLYYEHRNSEGVPEQWVLRMRNAISKVGGQFTTERMIREYMEQLYLPIITSST